MNEDKKRKNKIIGISIGILVVLLVVISSTYAYWQITKSQEGSNDIIAACLDIDMQSVDGTFVLNPAWPISDDEGLKLEGYTFTVTNNCPEDVNYVIGMDSLEVSGATYLSYDSIKVSMDNAPAMIYGEQETIEHIAEENDDYAIRDSKKIATSVVKNGQPNEHIVKVWIKSDAPVEEQSKVFSGRMFITGGQNIENDKPLAQIIATGDISKTENDNVTYKYYDNGDLIISGNGEIKDYNNGEFLTNLLNSYISYNNIELTSNELSLFNNPDILGRIMLYVYDNDEYTSIVTGGQLKNRDDIMALAVEIGIEETVTTLAAKIAEFKIRNIQIQDGITYIGANALSAILCKSIIMNVETIGNYALNSFGTIDNINFGNNLKTVNNSAISSSMIGTKFLKLPDSVEIVEEDAIKITNVETLILPKNNNFTSFSNRADNTFKNIIIPENVTYFYVESGKELITLNFYGAERELDIPYDYMYKEINWNYQGE